MQTLWFVLTWVKGPDGSIMLGDWTLFSAQGCKSFYLWSEKAFFVDIQHHVADVSSVDRSDSGLTKKTGVSHIWVWCRWCKSNWWGSKTSPFVLKSDRGIKGEWILFWYVQHCCKVGNTSIVVPLETFFHVQKLFYQQSFLPVSNPPSLSLTSVCMVDAQLKSLWGQGHCSWQAAFTDLSVG